MVDNAADQSNAETLESTRNHKPFSKAGDSHPVSVELTGRVPASTAGGYSPLQRRLHWIVAALVAFQLVLGISIGALDRPESDSRLQSLLIVHLIIGTVIFGLMWKRLLLRRQLGAPPSPQGTPLDAALLARINHLGFYGLLLALPVLGWLAFLCSGPAAATWGAIHGAVALTLFLAICAHLCGVIYHTYIRRDGLLRRMAG